MFESTATDRSVFVRRSILFAVVYVCVSGPLRWLFSALPWIDGNPAGAAIVLGGLLWGPAGGLGGMAGTVTTDVVIGAPSVETLCRVPGVGLASMSAYVLWGTTRPESASKHFDVRDLSRYFGTYVIVTVVSLCLYVATFAWVLEVLSLYSFSIVAPTQISSLVPLAIAAFPVWFVVDRRVDVGDSAIGRVRYDLTGGWGRYRKALFVVTPVAWIVIGTAVGSVFRATDLVPAERIGRRLVPLATTVLDLAGPRGTRVQLLGGAIALAIVLWVLREASRRGTY